MRACDVMSTKPPAPAVTCGRRRKPGDVDRSLAGRSAGRTAARAVEAARLEVGELVRRGHDGLGVRRAAEFEIEQRHAANRALLDDPGDRAVQPLLQQNARHVAPKCRSRVLTAGPVASSIATRRAITFSRLQVGVSKAAVGTRISPEMAGIVGRLCGLQLLRVHHDDDRPGFRAHAPAAASAIRSRTMRLTCAMTMPPVLRTASAWSSAPGKRLPARRSDCRARRRWCRDDRDVWRDGREEQPLLASEEIFAHDRCSALRSRVHRAALLPGSTNVSRPTFVSTPGRFAAASRCMSNMMPRGNVLGGDRVVADHPPDLRHSAATTDRWGRSRQIVALQHARDGRCGRCR